MNLPCPVHDGRPAHRGCHSCRRPICRLCELKMRGHLYCSPRCAREDGRRAFWRPLTERLVRPVPPRLALLAVALGVFPTMLLAFKTVGELDHLARPDVAPPLSSPRLARIERAEETASGTRVEGSGPAGGAVFLFAPSGFVATAPIVDGRFRFEKVSAPGPYRVGVLPLSSEAVSALPPAPPSAALSPAPVSRPAAAPAAASAAPVSSLSSPVSRLPSPGPVPDLTRGPANLPEIVVSFDAGSSDRGARQILDALAARRIRTTIFLTGHFIRRHPDLARRVAAEGHEAGNHTDTHPHLTTYARDRRQATLPGVDREFLARQLRATARAWREATGRRMAPLWRAPYGEQNGEIRRWAALEGYWHVGWTGGRAGLDGLDWVSDPSSRAYRSAEGVVERLVTNAENGGIILLHLGSDREDPVAPKVPELLDALARRGFRFARASEFLARLGRTGERLLAFRTDRPTLP